MTDNRESPPGPSSAFRLQAFSTPTLLEFLFVLYNATIMQHHICFANNNNNNDDNPGIVGRSFAI